MSKFVTGVLTGSEVMVWGGIDFKPKESEMENEVSMPDDTVVDNKSWSEIAQEMRTFGIRRLRTDTLEIELEPLADWDYVVRQNAKPDTSGKPDAG